MSSVLNIARQAMRAQSENMSTIGNNISNLRTVGYKQARTQFSEVIGGQSNAASSAGFNGGTGPSENSNAQNLSGISSIGTRDFLGDGLLQQTGGELDFAIQGSGQFVVRQYFGDAFDQAGETYLTSAGNFEFRHYYPTGVVSGEDEGLYLSDQNGHNVMGIMYDETTGDFGTAESLDALQPIRFANWARSSARPAIRSSSMTLSGNLNSAAAIGTRIDLGVSVFNGTGITNLEGTEDTGLVRDEIPLNAFLVKQSANVWSFVLVNSQRVRDKEVSELTDDELPDPTMTPLALVESESDQLDSGWKIQFGFDGEPVRMWKGSGDFPAPTDEVIDVSGGQLAELAFDVTQASGEDLDLGLGQLEQRIETGGITLVKSPMTLAFDIRELTSFSSSNAVDIRQNGSAIVLREFSDISVDEEGIISRRFSDDSRVPLAKISAASARGINNLRPVNGTLYAITEESGAVTIHDFGTGSRNRLVTGALEASDVDLSEAFADMIIGQRSYSLSAQTLTTAIEMEKRALEMK